MKKRIIFAILAVFMLAIPLFAGCEWFGNGGSKEAIKIYTNIKTEYEVGDQLDVTNGKIEYTDENGNKTIIAISADMITSFSTTTAGENREMILTYKGKTLTINYSVFEIVDIEKDALYYCNPSGYVKLQREVQGATDDSNNYYDYFIIKSDKICFFESNEIPYNLLANTQEYVFSTNSYSYNTEIKNHKKVYTTYIHDGDAKLVATVVDQNTLKVKLSASFDEQNYEQEFTMVKYFG